MNNGLHPANNFSSHLFLGGHWLLCSLGLDFFALLGAFALSFLKTFRIERHVQAIKTAKTSSQDAGSPAR